MRHVISAPAGISLEAFTGRLAAVAPATFDPMPALCRRYGYENLYEIPAGLQMALRRELIRAHAEALRASPDVVCDHSVFAYLADWMRWLWSETTAREWEAVLVEAWPAVDRSETIHHVVSGPPRLDLRLRRHDAAAARQQDRLVRNLYREFACEDRVQEAAL